MNLEQLAKAKSLGSSDRKFAHLTHTTEAGIRAERKRIGLVPMLSVGGHLSRRV